MGMYEGLNHLIPTSISRSSPFYTFARVSFITYKDLQRYYMAVELLVLPIPPQRLSAPRFRYVEFVPLSTTLPVLYVLIS